MIGLRKIRICTIQNTQQIRLVYFEQEVSNEKEEHTLARYIYHHDTCHYTGVSLYQCNSHTHADVDANAYTNADAYADADTDTSPDRCC